MIQWTDSLATGHQMVDQDHQQLIKSLNELEQALKNGAGREQVTQLIAFLNDYARGHFSREEAHMVRVGCPAHAENQREHQQFVARLDGWVSRLKFEGSSTPLVLEVYRDTSAWIRAHILKVDCKLRGCRLA
jgi:hemerythrin-like metal-binding protein